MQFNIKYENIKNFLNSQGYEVLNRNFVEQDLINKSKYAYLHLYINNKNNWCKVGFNALNFTIEIEGLDYSKDLSKQWRIYLKDTYKQHYTNYIKRLYLKHKQALNFYENVLDDLKDNNEQTFKHTL